MKNKLSLKTRKCLEIQIGKNAANEIYELINSMSEEISILKRKEAGGTRYERVSHLIHKDRPDTHSQRKS